MFFHHLTIAIALKLAKIQHLEVWWKWKLSNFLFLKCENFHFQFFIKLRDAVSLRVLELWQWSNNEKASIFIEEFEFYIFIGARALPRALRAISDTLKISFLGTFQSTEGCARNFGARQPIQNQKLHLLCIYNML